MRANWRILRREGAIKTRLPARASPLLSIVGPYRGKKLARLGPGPIIFSQKVGKSSAIQSPPRRGFHLPPPESNGTTVNRITLVRGFLINRGEWKDRLACTGLVYE